MQRAPTEQFRSATENAWWTVHRGDGPIVGTAIHNGHAMRSDARALVALTDEQRLREEDPFTEFIIRDLANRILALRPGLPVLFTTGYTRNAIIHHGRLDPGVQLLSKPFAQHELARKVREMLDGVGPAKA